MYQQPRDVYIDSNTLPRTDFFQRTNDTDPRVRQVLDRAEEEYYREKQRQADLDSYHARMTRKAEYDAREQQLARE